MDIRQWLQNTADREPPDEHVETGFPAFLQPKPDPTQPKRRSRQKRKRASSDPPVSALRASRERRRPVQSSNSEPGRRSGNSTVATTSQKSSSSRSESSQSSVSNRHQAPVETFQRRARHKTRPDRYESKPKRKKKDHRSSRETKPEPRRRRSHRNGDGARTTGLVQSFHLKNGPKNHRLTLKPDASAGIFKNGRASGPVATSGPGLPDLVFNEMRFLCRPKEHQDELPVDDSTKQSKKTRKEIQEEEISSYFNRKLPPDKQRGLRKPGAAQTQAAQQSVTQRPPELDLGPPRHPVELPGRAFLGFGSRGPPQEAVERRLSSNSCYTWSESLPARRTPPSGRTDTMALDAVKELPEHRDVKPSQVSNTSLPDIKADIAKLRQQQRQSSSRSGQWIENRRAKPPAMIEAYQLPKPTVDVHTTDKSLEPLSGGVSKSRNAELEEINIRWETGSYHTSDILKIRDTINELQRPQPLAGKKRGGKAMIEKANEVPATSTPTSERLRHVFGNVTNPTRTALTEAPSVRSTAGLEERVDIPTKPPAAQRYPSRGYIDAKSSSPRWELPQRGFSRTIDVNRSQHRPLSRHATTTRLSSKQGLQPDSREVHGPKTSIRDAPDEEEMLGIMPDALQLGAFRDPRHINTREAESLLRRLEFESDDGYPQVPRIEEGRQVDGYGSLEDQEELVALDEGSGPASCGPMSLGHGCFSFPSQRLCDEVSGIPFRSEHYAMDGHQGGEESHRDHRELVNSEFAGFWRPNILY